MSSPYADPELWEEAKRAARERLGGHSARAMQLAGELYRRAGGRYKGRKTAAQRSLTRWTRQDWTTASGMPSRETGERYLPRKVLERLTPAERGATTRAKRAGTRAGKQYVAQPPRIRAKVARLKREINPMARTPTPAQIAARERFAEMARSGAFKRKAAKARKANPLNDDGRRITITDTYQRSVVEARDTAEHYANQLRMRGRDDVVFVVFAITPEAKKQAGRLRSGLTITLNPRNFDIAYAIHPTRGNITSEYKTKRNPAKKTVSQKISQLTREGYPQKQAVAIALSEERAGKVRANPRPPLRRVPMVGSDLNAFDQAFRLLDDLDFEKWRMESAFRERRVSEAKAVKANAMLDRVLDGLERIAKLING